MKFLNTKIKDLKIIKLDPFIDNRGYLKRVFCENQIKKNKLSFKINQTNISFNKKAKTLRGFHYQQKPFEEKKIISCISGSIHNIVIDLRKNSKTFLKWQSFEITEKNQLSLLLPPMCANAFLTLKHNTTVLYFHSNYHNPKYSKTFNYEDPSFSFDWPYKPVVISKKDKQSKFFSLNNL